MCGDIVRPDPADDGSETSEVPEAEPIPPAGSEGLAAADDREDQWWVERLNEKLAGGARH
jgi:hypothetical protein